MFRVHKHKRDQQHVDAGMREPMGSSAHDSLKRIAELEQTLARTRDRAARKRRALENRLRAAESRIDQISRNIPDIIFSLSLPDLVPIFVSHAVEPLLGFTPEAIVADPDLWRRQLHQDDLEPVLDSLKSLAWGADPLSIEARFWHRDGATVRWFEGRVAAERSSDGQARALFGVMTDITARKQAGDELQRHRDRLAELVQERTSELSAAYERLKREVCERSQAEQALREREKLLGLFVSRSPAAVAMFDHSMRYLLVSDRWRQDYRLGEQELVGRSHYDVFPDVPERWKEVHRHCLKGAVEKCDEDVFPRADGRVDWLRWEIHPWRVASGEVGGLIVFTELITERRKTERELALYREQLEELVVERTEQWKKVNERLEQEVQERRAVEAALRQSEQTLRLVTDAIPALISYVDAEQRYRFNNRGYEQWHGKSRAELQGRSVREVVGEIGYRLVEPYIRRALAGEQVSYETTFPYSDGVARRIHVTYIPDVREDGAVLGFFTLVSDITEHYRAESLARMHMVEVAHVSRLSTMGGMATEMAHELNQPLTAIAGYADACARMLVRDDCGKGDIADVLASIAEQAHRAGEIIRRLRAFVGKQAAHYLLLDINDLVHETLKFVEVEARWHNVELSVELARNLLPVSADRILIEQVILNLVRNAIEAMDALPDGRRRLGIRTQQAAGDRVAVMVHDSGPGLAPEHQQRVFDPFFTTKAEGMGMGLSISRSIVELHGGSMRVTSNDAEGATFQFELPAVREG